MAGVLAVGIPPNLLNLCSTGSWVMKLAYSGKSRHTVLVSLAPTGPGQSTCCSAESK